MREWRVGTWSMGVTLILFGTVLFLSQWQHREAFAILIDWWPAVFILLGLEILIYLAVKRKESPIVKYDVFSVLFVGFLCFVCVVLALLASTGLADEVRYALGAVEHSVELPAIEQAVAGDVQKIVVMNHAFSSVAIDTAGGSTLSVFGALRMEAAKDAAADGIPPDNIVTLHRVGDTLYVQVNEPPVRYGLMTFRPRLNLTIVVPEGVETEAHGRHSFIYGG